MELSRDELVDRVTARTQGTAGDPLTRAEVEQVVDAALLELHGDPTSPTAAADAEQAENPVQPPPSETPAGTPVEPGPPAPTETPAGEPTPGQLPAEPGPATPPGEQQSE